MKTHNKSRSVKYLIAYVTFFFLLLALIPNQQRVSIAFEEEDPTPTPTPTPDLEMERLRREAELSGHRATKATNEQTIAEAQKAEFEARFPKPSTSPLAGTTTVEGAVIESQILAYRTLNAAAREIVDSIDDHFKPETKLAVYNERDVNLILSYRVAEAQVSLIQEGYKKLMPTSTVKTTAIMTPTPCPTPGPSPEATPKPAPEVSTTEKVPAIFKPIKATESFLGAFVDMTALLRTNVEIKGQTFAIDEGPLVAEVFKVARPQIKGGMYYPYVFPLDVDKQGSLFLAHLQVAHELRVEAEKLLGDLLQTNKELAEANDAVEQLEALIGRALPKKTVSTVSLAGNVIKASCRRYTADVELIKDLDFHKQSEQMRKLIQKVHKNCVRMDRDKMEILLGLGDTLAQLEKDLNDAGTNLQNAKDTQTKLAQKLADLVVKLGLGNVGNPPDPDKVRERAEFAIARLEAINAQFDSLVAALIHIEPGGSNVLTNYIRIERLRNVIGPCDYWLQLKVINAGGNNRIKTNLLVDIFRGGNRLSHSGGVIAQYHLYNFAGQSIESGVVSKYGGYVDSGKLK